MDKTDRISFSKSFDLAGQNKLLKDPGQVYIEKSINISRLMSRDPRSQSPRSWNPRSQDSRSQDPRSWDPGCQSPKSRDPWSWDPNLRSWSLRSRDPKVLGP